MYYVDILKSLYNGTFYKGFTDNIDRRIDEHQNGKTSSNKQYRPFRLIHVEICKDRAEARKLEIFFKSGFGREIISEIDQMLCF
jgi:putative endonuclease